MFLVGFMIGFFVAIAGAHGVAQWVESIQAEQARRSQLLESFRTFKANEPPLPSYEESVPASWQE